MDFRLFYCCGALLFALGVIEVATITPYDVTSIKSGDFSGGHGCLVYYPQLCQFEFIPKTHFYYKEIKEALVEAGDDKGKLLAEGKNRDKLMRAYHLMSVSLNMVGATKREGAEFYYSHEIKSCSYSSKNNSLQFVYDFIEVIEVEVKFAEDSGLKKGLKAVIDILSGAGINCTENE